MKFRFRIGCRLWNWMLRKSGPRTERSMPTAACLPFLNSFIFRPELCVLCLITPDSLERNGILQPLKWSRFSRSRSRIIAFRLTLSFLSSAIHLPIQVSALFSSLNEVITLLGILPALLWPLNMFYFLHPPRPRGVSLSVILPSRVPPGNLPLSKALDELRLGW